MISFLKDVFLPGQFRDYFLFPTSFLAIEQDGNKICATKLTAVGQKRSITYVIEKPVVMQNNEHKEEAIAKTIADILKEVGSYQELVLILPNEGIIFKELSVPFLDHEKIAEILPFEVEPLIPFSKELARIEFIQTKIHADGKSDILVAIAQQSFIDHHITPLQSTGVMPQRVSVKSFLTWYAFMHSNVLTSEEHLVIDFDDNYCTLLFFVQRQLRIVRVIAYGIQFIVNQITQNTQRSKQEVLQSLEQNIELLPEQIRTQYTLGIKKFKNDLFFTIQSLTPQYTSLNLTCLHKEYELPGLMQLLVSELRAENRPLSITSLVQQLNIQMDNNKKIGITFLPCIIASLPAPEIIRVNFARNIETKVLYNLYMRQVFTTFLISFSIIFFIVFSYRNNLNVLNKEIQSSETEIIRTLKAEFDVPTEEKNVDDVVDYASREVTNKQKTWLAFSNQARTSLLQYLLELTERINKEALGFVLERIIFDQNKIILKAEVRDYEALKILERELRQSKLFTYVEPQDNPRFTMTINLIQLGEQE